jgi:hypothetical protein
MKKAISLLQKCPAMSVKEWMLIAGFSKKEIEDNAKQAWIYHHGNKANPIRDKSPSSSSICYCYWIGGGGNSIVSVAVVVSQQLGGS